MNIHQHTAEVIDRARRNHYPLLTMDGTWVVSYQCHGEIVWSKSRFKTLDSAKEWCKLHRNNQVQDV